VSDQFLDDYHVVVMLEPGLAGPNTLQVDFHPLAEGDVRPVGATAIFELEDPPAGPLAYELTHVTGSRWRTEVSLPVAGRWHMTLAVRVDVFTEERVDFFIPLGR
jgi:hypothetical protein